jgi:regulator of PEP synthase PpsR (kinase-PPPase family)
MSDSVLRPVFIISDGTGDTADKVTRAALRQFEGAKVAIQLFPTVTDKSTLERILKQAALQTAFVVTSLVSAEQRTHANELCKAWKLLHVDVLGTMIAGLSGWLQQAPQSTPGLFHRVDAAYFRRIEAIEFAIKMDDGKEPRGLSHADIVLVGVSRTSKTPLSVLLAYKGYKVANVPLVLDREPNTGLWEIDQQKVFALTIEPSKLQEIRQQRLKTMRVVGSESYSDMDYILAELEFAEALFRRNRQWPVINVTNKAVEETAAAILALMSQRGMKGEHGEAGQL